MPLCASLQDPLQIPLPRTEALQSYSYIRHQPALFPLGKNTFLFVRMKFLCCIFSPLEFWQFKTLTRPYEKLHSHCIPPFRLYSRIRETSNINIYIAGIVFLLHRTWKKKKYPDGDPFVNPTGPFWYKWISLVKCLNIQCILLKKYRKGFNMPLRLKE